MAENIEHPPWLKANQNGSIGEARSKAFLLDRFWVLERSVDIDGADFIIQRRITSRNLFDRDPPRFGVVQVKFFGTENTTHYVHTEYVTAEDGSAQREFFVLCHSGGEEDPKLFLLSGGDLHKEFSVITRNASDCYRLGFSAVCATDKFLVRNRKLALDRIENAMDLADFVKNRRFVSWVLPDPKGELDAILPEFKEPIENNWGNLPEGFRRIKEQVRSDLFRIEEVYEILAKIMGEVDPIAAARLVEDAAYYCRGGGHGRRWSISLEGDYDDDDFFNECRRHIFVVKGLKEIGLLDSFIQVKSQLKSEVVAFLEAKLPLGRDDAHVFFVEFDIERFTIKSFTSEIVAEPDLIKRLEEAGESLKAAWRGGVEIPEFKEVEPSTVRGIWFPCRFDWGNSKGEEQTAAHFKEYEFSIYRECVNYLLHKRFPAEFEWAI